MDNVSPRRTSADCYAVEIEFPSLPLLPGKYFIRMHVLDPEGVRMFDTLEKPLVVTGVARELGLIRIEHRWRVADATRTAQTAPTAHAASGTISRFESGKS
jgi:lipopolysaccharide transport system ATP-binding protein